jgi:hypothetical protein
VLGVVGTDGQIGAPGAPEGKKRFLISHRSEEEVGGRVSPDKPLRISAVVSIDEEDEEVSVNLEVLGKEVRDLAYEARVAPQD